MRDEKLYHLGERHAFAKACGSWALIILLCGSLVGACVGFYSCASSSSEKAAKQAGKQEREALVKRFGPEVLPGVFDDNDGNAMVVVSRPYGDGDVIRMIDRIQAWQALDPEKRIVSVTSITGHVAKGRPFEALLIRYDDATVVIDGARKCDD